MGISIEEKAIQTLNEIIDEGWLISDMEKCTAIDAKRNRLMNRNYSVCADRAAGHTYRQIAENNNISITRVRQIINRWMAEYINKYKPLYLCNPELNNKCEKTSCQTDCFHTTNPDYSLDGKKYNIDLKTCEIREIPKGNE